jgi:hypothetical protein
VNGNYYLSLVGNIELSVMGEFNEVMNNLSVLIEREENVRKKCDELEEE